jgi:hypothetical protein
MKIKYNTGYQFIAWIVLTSLFLQSCSSLESSLIPIKKNPIEHTSALALIKQIKPLVDKQLIAQGGHTVTFYMV